MGCRKLTYYRSQGQEAVKPFLLKNTGTLSKKGATEKKRYDYYPFGMVMEGTAYNDELTRHPQLYKFNGNEVLEGEGIPTTLNLMNFNARLYNPALGVFLAVDPMAASFAGLTPYNFGFNNPTLLSDPNGECPVCFIVLGKVLVAAVKGAVIQAAIQGATYSLTAAFTGNWDSGQFGKSVARGAVTGFLTGGFAMGGTALASSLANGGSTIGEGLLNLGYQVATTTGSGVLTNLAMGDDPFAYVNIGVTNFTIPIRNGKVSANPLDHIGNFASGITYTRGFIDVKRGLADVEFNKVTLSPRFIEKSNNSRFGIVTDNDARIVKAKYKKASNTSRLLADKNDNGVINDYSSGINQNGVAFISYEYEGVARVYLHESLHGIFSRINGQFNPWLDYKIFRMSKYWADPSKRFYERVINGF